MFACKEQDKVQCLFVAVEVPILLSTQEGQVVDEVQFIRFDGVRYDAFAKLRLFAVYVEVELREHFLQEEGDLFELLTIVAEYAIVIAVAQNFEFSRDVRLLHRLVQHEVGIAQDDFAQEVKERASLRNAHVPAVVHHVEQLPYGCRQR